MNSPDELVKSDLLSKKNLMGIYTGGLLAGLIGWLANWILFVFAGIDSQIVILADAIGENVFVAKVFAPGLLALCFYIPVVYLVKKQWKIWLPDLLSITLAFLVGVLIF